jgi:nucleotide-binding universal stress UspA family protein
MSRGIDCHTVSFMSSLLFCFFIFSLLPECRVNRHPTENTKPETRRYPMYQTVLVPLDGSSRAESILPHVENLAMQFKSKVYFLQVVTLHDATIQIDDIDQYLYNFNQKKEEIRAYLACIQEEFQKKGIVASCLIEEGEVVETILSVAQRENADLIAIASHGRSGLSRVFYGSVAAGIMQKIDRPMLVIRTRNV